jgi:hypothetical protein
MKRTHQHPVAMLSAIEVWVRNCRDLFPHNKIFLKFTDHGRVETYNRFADPAHVYKARIGAKKTEPQTSFLATIS